MMVWVGEQKVVYCEERITNSWLGAKIRIKE